MNWIMFLVCMLLALCLNMWGAIMFWAASNGLVLHKSDRLVGVLLAVVGVAVACVGGYFAPFFIVLK